MQIYFTGVQAIPLFLFLGLLFGRSISFIFASVPAVRAAVGTLLFGYLAPILVAFIILGRSGTAITVELGNMTVLGEIRLLRRLGIDPFRHVIFPRLAGVTLATFLIASFFGVAITAVSALFSNENFYLFMQKVVQNWTVTDVMLMSEKSIFFGLIISMVACYQGLNLIPATTEVPKATIRTVIHDNRLCGTINVIFVYFRYRVVGL